MHAESFERFGILCFAHLRDSRQPWNLFKSMYQRRECDLMSTNIPTNWMAMIPLLSLLSIFHEYIHYIRHESIFRNGIFFFRSRWYWNRKDMAFDILAEKLLQIYRFFFHIYLHIKYEYLYPLWFSLWIIVCIYTCWMSHMN